MFSKTISTTNVIHSLFLEYVELNQNVFQTVLENVIHNDFDNIFENCLENFYFHQKYTSPFCFRNCFE